MEKLATVADPLSELGDLDKDGLYQAILEVSNIITTSKCISNVYREFAVALRTLLEFDRANITLFDEVAGTVVIHHHFGQEIGERAPNQPRKLIGTRAHRVLTSGQTVVESDISMSVPISPASEQALRYGLKSSIAIPIRCRGRIIGVLSLRSCLPCAYGHRERIILECLSNFIAPAVDYDLLTEQVNPRFQGTAVRKEDEDYESSPCNALPKGPGSGFYLFSGLNIPLKEPLTRR